MNYYIFSPLILVILFFIIKYIKIKRLSLLHLAAEKGDVKAQYKLGNMYALGKGVEENALEAIRWYSRSAEQCNTLESAFSIQKIRLLVLREASIATSLLESLYNLAEQGDKNAQLLFAECRIGGYAQPAQQGNVVAQLMMGLNYAQGQCGYKINYQESIRWIYNAKKLFNLNV